MYRKKHKQRKSAKGLGKGAALTLTAVLLSTVVLGTTLAILRSETGRVKNTFQRAEMSCQVEETFDGTTKTNVTVKNTSVADQVSGYIRAAVIINWEDDYGNVYAQEPEAGTDYEITYGSDWVPANGYYYWPQEVEPDNSTGVLISRCEQKGTAPEGYTLVVDILAEIIQSNPTTAVKEAWGYDPAGGTP